MILRFACPTLQVVCRWAFYINIIPHFESKRKSSLAYFER